ncbi:FAD-dependent oxidoreductase [Crassaminicella profunda]|uniref:FAD-dependent oxidoreductase n=1 Tax=Crassaminicella profunda TaxID=1286698 RepID=UPI001CA5F916|nr:FAD-dependent oxidoreductase [Crassaminicella profunda]QZY54498.1 FAD-dependent oxidoreductase [Crassaminicella profunda]
MQKVDLLIIGGSAGGILSATTARKVYGDIDITVIRDKETVMVPCGIPYIYGTLKDTSKNIIPDKVLTSNDINLLVDKVTKINKQEKFVVTEKNENIYYDKLIIATGSLPIIPSFPGKELENIFPVYKDEVYLKSLLAKMSDFQDIVVIGGGFIGVEFAEQMKKSGKNITLVQRGDKCLRRNFDAEFSDEAEKLLIENGINVKTNTQIEEFIGEKCVKEIKLSNGETIKADAVLLGAGVKANSILAQDAGIEVNDDEAIVVNEYMRTSDPDVLAVGDCAQKTCFFTRNSVPILLASTAAVEAKIAGYNVFKNKLTRKNKGTINAFSTKIYGRAFGAVGLTEKQAIAENFDIVVGEFSTMDHHPGSLPNTQTIKMKLIFSKYSGVIMGGQISGGDSIGEMINILSLAIQQGMSAADLNTLQVATHPLLTASPIAYPINGAAMNVIEKM